ncbi:MAG TPA: hypothetical protein VKW06_00410 [Candidatus Angelobacter sp.]|nr:hypothetical protein [Candidatus Angelobacter sp.]
MQLINKTDLQFSDISSEKYRQYTFAASDGSDITIRVHAPLYLNVSESGGHRILDAEGVSHYIPPKWIHLEWKTKDGQPHFVK